MRGGYKMQPYGPTARTGTLPGQGNTLDEQQAALVCTTVHSDTGRHCYAPPIGVVTLGCIHEHLHYAAVCAGCLAQVHELQAVGQFICHYCETSARPHDCAMHELAWESR